MSELAALIEAYQAAYARLAAEPSPDGVNACLDALAQILAHPSLTATARADCLLEAGRRMLDRHLLLGRSEDLDHAAALIAHALDGRPAPPEVDVELGLAYRRRFSVDHAADDVRRATEHLQRGAGGFAGPPEIRARALLNLLDGHRELWLATRDAADLDRAITTAQWVVELSGTAPGAERAWYLNRLAARLHDRYELTRSCADLDAAIAAQREGLTAPGLEPAGRLQYIERLASYLGDRVVCSGAISDLQEAIALVSPEIDDQPRDAARRPLLTLRGTLHRSLYERTGAIEAIDAAISDQETALSSPELAADELILLRVRCANARRDRYRDAGDPADLEAAIGHAEAAIAGLSDDDPRACWVLNTCALSYGLRYERTGEAGALERALAGWREAVASGRRHARRVDLPIALNNLGDYLTRHEYPRGGDLALLDESVGLLREAAAFEDREQMPRILNTHGLVLQYRFEARGDPEDLRAAIALHERSVELTPAGAAHLPMRLDNLARALVSAAGLWGQAGAADRAIELRRRACDLAGPGNHSRDGYLANLAATHLEAHRFDADALHLSEAEQIVARLRRDEQSWTGTAALVTSALVALAVHDQTGDPALIEEALALYNRALEKSASEPAMRPVVLMNLARAMHLHGLALGSSRRIEAAIQLMELAVAQMPPAAHDRAFAELALASGYWVRGTVTGRRHDLDAAVRLSTGVLSGAAEGTTGELSAAHSLGLALRSRYRLDAQPDDLARGREMFERVARTPASPMAALRASTCWGEWAQERGQLAEAVTAYRLGMEAMYRMFEAQLLRPHRELALREAAGLPNRLAVVLAGVGELEEAVRVLERGRTLLTNSTLDLARTRLESLPAVGHAALLQRYLAAASAAEALAREGSSAAALSRPQIRSLEEAHDELAAIIAEIRTVEGFSDFPRPGAPTREQVRELAAPCVFVVPGLRDGVAIRVDASGAHARPLPNASESAVARRVEEWRAGEQPAQALVDVCGWLWEVAMGETVALLERDGEAIAIPCGAFVDLPLHAAWRAAPEAAGARRYVIDDHLLRYASSIRAALDAQRRSAARGAHTLRAVSDDSLAHAGSEVAGIRSYFAAADVRCTERARTGHTELIAELAQFDLLHFACHGLAQPDHALASAIIACADAPLTVAELLECRLDRVRLAVLSACESALGDRRLRDEVITLPAALLQAGAAAAIGSLWPVNDTTTAALMQRFYWNWRVGELSPAQALRHAQTWLRDPDRADDGPALPEPADGIDPTHPIHWAPFVFVGA